MIAITPIPTNAPDLERLSADELLGALRDVARDRDATAARRDRLAAALARREEEQRAALATTRQVWGAGFAVAAPTGDREGERLRADLAATEARLPVIAARRAAVCTALRRRVAREETALAEERAVIARDTASVAARQARARELWQPLAAYEGLPTGDPPIAGATQQLALGLWSRRDQLARREQERARRAGALARAEQDD